ncbi:FAD-binding protein [Streptomyces sp. NPDC088554]|uniref:FAD-binding protein n=1 Tax=Streptomyces sp. NPDC088554 TaxID=3365865 RepID=UPI0038005996
MSADTEAATAAAPYDDRSDGRRFMDLFVDRYDDGSDEPDGSDWPDDDWPDDDRYDDRYDARYDDDRFVSLTGWGRTAPTTALLVRPRSYDETVAAVRDGGARGTIPRGLGRACGDAAQNAGGSVLDMTGLDRIRAIDATAGVVVCEAGVSLHRLMEVLLPLGWFLPVTPETRYVTVGGAIGADVHGRNHPAAGGFSRHVSSLDLLTADGERRTVLPGTPLFDATAGGLGLTGVILGATLRLRRVATSLMSVETERITDFDALLAGLASTDRPGAYAVAWIDLTARGTSLGRSVLTRGDHTPLNALPARARRHPLTFRPVFRPGSGEGRLGGPVLVPSSGLLGRATAGLFNELWYRAAPRHRTGRQQRLPAFFHPLDALPQWNRMYGRDGFVQYQFAVPYGQEETLRQILERIARRGGPVLPAVLGRFGAGGPGWLSFPAPGWTLTLDLPAGRPGLGRLLDELDDEVAAAGGRVALAKDARLRPELLATMYPRLAEFRALRAALDPGSVFVSDLSRRLSL